jgi:peptidoglycan/LPS O-acetylase OafA/YrhL
MVAIGTDAAVRRQAYDPRDLPLTSAGTADSRAIHYRPDLDGLRAIAVWSVIIFHLVRTALPAGYLGVDIFFVLSGFLITSILWREAQLGELSIVRFYDRRIRRIMPALIVLLVVISIVSLLMLLPADLIGYGRSVLATLAFVANIYFWRDTDYFTRAAEMKPLLHLWSLGVEEQFYILLPGLLALTARYWRAATLPAVALLTVASFAADVYLNASGGSGPAFYLLPTRGWELGIGAILALLPADLRVGNVVAICVAIAASALVALGLAGFALAPFVPLSLSVTVGTALLIFSGRRNTTLPNRLLRSPVLVWFGLISYSLYLWHWPIIVLAHYYLVRDFTVLEAIGLTLLMVILAAASWWFVERPFRDASLPIVTVRRAAAASAALLAILAFVTIQSHGFPQRLNAQAAAINEAVDTHFRCPVSGYLVFGSSRGCVMNLPSRNPADADVVLLGNSHAQMYAPAWAAMLEERKEKGLLVPLNACLPTVQANIEADCIPAAAINLSAVLSLDRPKTVVLAMTWHFSELTDASGKVRDNRDNTVLIAALDDLIARIERRGKHVVLIGPIAEPGWDIASTVSRQLAFGWPVTEATFEDAAGFYRHDLSVIRHFEARHDIAFVRPDLVQCRQGRCDYIRNGRSFFSDSNHVAASALPQFREIFERALPWPGPQGGAPRTAH